MMPVKNVEVIDLEKVVIVPFDEFHDRVVIDNEDPFDVADDMRRKYGKKTTRQKKKTTKKKPKKESKDEDKWASSFANYLREQIIRGR